MEKGQRLLCRIVGLKLSRVDGPRLLCPCTVCVCCYYYYTTDYTLSSTARAFVPYYSQRICTAIRMHGAQGILMRISRARRDRLRTPPACA